MLLRRAGFTASVGLSCLYKSCYYRELALYLLRVNSRF